MSFLRGRPIVVLAMPVVSTPAAGLAREIHNPIAAMQPRAESAPRGDAARQEKALPTIIEQVDRVAVVVSGIIGDAEGVEPRERTKSKSFADGAGSAAITTGLDLSTLRGGADADEEAASEIAQPCRRS